MDSFLGDAASILETAEAVARSGGPLSECAILVSRDGAISVVMDSDWPLRSLQAERGARAAYKVSQTDRKVRVEGMAGVRTCLFEAEKPDGAARLLLADRRDYFLEGSVNPPPRREAASGARGEFRPAPRHADSARLLPAASD